MEELKQNKMAATPVGRLLASMAAPAIIAMLIQALYNIVDSVYVSQVSEQALLAVSLAYPLQILLIAVAVGTGVGLNSLISRRLGEGNFEEAGKAAMHGLVLAVFSWLFFLLIAIFAVRPYFHAFTSDPTVYVDGIDYTILVLGVSLFTITSMIVEKIVQATGNMICPMIQNAAGAITNIILDPILIFGKYGAPKMGVTGAAIATIVGQFVGMVIGLIVLFCVKHDFKATLRGFRLSGRMIGQIYQVGVPGIVMQAIMSVMLAGMNAILTPLSAVAVAVVGVYFKLQSFVFMPVFGLTQGAMPIMGYSFGARSEARLMRTYKVTFITAFFIMLAGTIVFWIIPDKLLLMFSASEEMLSIGIPALRAISLSFVGAAFGIVNSTVFQAVGHGMASLIVSVARQLVVILPAAWLLAHFVGLHAVWYAFPVAEILSFLVSFILFLKIYKREIKTLSHPVPPKA